MSTQSRPFTALAAVVFALVALAHLLRAAFGLDVVVGGYAVPLSVSVLATIVAGGLALLVWREAHG
jgi:hypothetical protein